MLVTSGGSKKSNRILMRRIIIFGLFLFIATWLLAYEIQDDLDKIEWTKYSDEDNIQVYEAKRAHKSGLIPIKVHTILDYPITKVLTVLTDASRKTEWVPRLDVSKTVEQLKFGEFIDYASFDAPWPFEDRDFLVYIKTNYDIEKKEVKAVIYSVTHPQMPNRKGFVRGHTFSGNTYLKSVYNDTKTYVEISFFNDYKGNIPKWIVNMVQLTWPRTFIGQLRTQLAKKDVSDTYQNLDVVTKYLEKKQQHHVTHEATVQK